MRRQIKDGLASNLYSDPSQNISDNEEPAFALVYQLW